MYAFIEVIDIVGGVDVHLDQPVIDPTYKTFDGGKWGTLYYRAGDYHLTGKQALRLARTRHTSSDFARAERQQMILQSLQQKARNFGFGNAAALTNIAERILAKVETDINLADAISYYFRYQHFDISRGHVLSTANVLESKFTGDLKKLELNCDSQSAQAKTAAAKAGVANEGPDAAKDPCAEIDKGAYILEPKDGNWNSVRWYFHQIIEGEAV
jgi:anionic cell wall polymer biosynthesis LytR-Cps2A-Psr (LCP) family protein